MRISISKRGSSLTGYGLVVGLIAVVALSALTSIGDEIDVLFSGVASDLSSVSSGQQEIVSPTPTPFACGSAVLDHEGNSYTTGEFAGLCWMTENVNMATAQSGSAIADSDCYGGNPANCSSAGRLYSFASAKSGNDGGPVCPEGWSLPSSSQFLALADLYYAPPACSLNYTNWECSPAGDQLRLGPWTAQYGGAEETPGSFIVFGTHGYLAFSDSIGGQAFKMMVSQSGLRFTDEPLTKISVRCVR